MNRTLRYILGFAFGALLGFSLAALVAFLIRAIAPAEHMLRGLAGTLISFVSIPILGIFLAIKFGRVKSDDPK
jgi:uncharacterized membrane protein required for colicin V production